MSNNRVGAGRLPSRKIHSTQLPAVIASEPPHNSPHYRNLQPLKSAIHRNPAHSTRFHMRKMGHVQYPPPGGPVGHAQIPAMSRPAVVQSVSTTVVAMYVTN